jgi:hypothetical protein
MDTTGRHPGTVAVARWFGWEHLLPDLQPISKGCHDLAEQMLQRIPDDPELVIGLRHLLDAKDAFVRAAIAARAGTDG